MNHNEIILEYQNLQLIYNTYHKIIKNINNNKDFMILLYLDKNNIIYRVKALFDIDKQVKIIKYTINEIKTSPDNLDKNILRYIENEFNKSESIKISLLDIKDSCPILYCKLINKDYINISTDMHVNMTSFTFNFDNKYNIIINTDFTNSNDGLAYKLTKFDINGYNFTVNNFNELEVLNNSLVKYFNFSQDNINIIWEFICYYRLTFF